MKAREAVEQIESNPIVPAGSGDRFAGYAVLGLPFRSGHVLALRRFPASSIGPGYTAVWHRDPRGVWTFYSTINPDLGCSRYFGGEVSYNLTTPIGIEWTGAMQFSVSVGITLHWEVRLTAALVMNGLMRLVPDSWWDCRSTLEAIGSAGRVALGTGKLKLVGRTPNGQEFFAHPQQVWLIDSSHAILNGTDLGPVGALHEQARLEDFYIPQRGIFVIVQAFLQTPRRTSTVAAGRSRVL